MEVYVIQSKNGIIMNVIVSVKMIGVLVTMIMCGILAHVIVNLTKHAKFMSI